MDLHDTIRTYRLFSGSYDIVFGPGLSPGAEGGGAHRQRSAGPAYPRGRRRHRFVAPPFPRGFAGHRHRRLGGDAGEGAAAGRAPAAFPCRGSAPDGCREPRISGQFFRRRAGPLRRLGRAEPGALRRRNAPRLHSRRDHRRRQPLHQREPARRASSKSAWPGSPAISAFTPTSRSTPSGATANCRSARCGPAICSAIGSCCAASTKSPPPIPAEPMTGREQPVRPVAAAER